MAININGTGSITGLSSISAPGISGVPVGSASAPAFSFTGDTNTGIYSPGADQVAISTNGTGRLFVDANGTVRVNSAIQATSNGGLNVEVTSSGSSSAPFTLLNRGTSNNTGVYLTFRGLSSASAETDYAYMQMFATDTSSRNGAIAFWTTNGGSPGERLRITSAGNVGIGSTNPGAFSIYNNLVVENSSNPGITLSNSSGAGTAGIHFAATSTFQGKAEIACDITTGALFAKVAGTERCRVDNSGRLLVGTSTGATDGSVLLQVNGGISINGVTSSSAVNSAGHYISPVINSSGQNTCKSATNDTSGSGDLWQFSRINTDGVIFRFHRGTTSVGTISITGSATSYVTSSDYRLKKNIAPVTDGIVRLQQLKPSRFNFIVDPDKTVDGFLAHEVQTVVPEAITGEKDAVDDEGNPQYQGIDQSKLVPLLTAALQEAIGEIELLKSRLTAAGI